MMTTNSPVILQDRLAQVENLYLTSGSHFSIEEGACVMEVVSYVAGEPWTDSPQCACPVISMFLRGWNDALNDADRNRLLKPLIPKLVGTLGTAEIEHKRSLMCADWVVRVHTPGWLRLAGLTAQADALADLPQITSMAQAPGIRPVIEAARSGADAALVAARAARDAAALGAALVAARAARDAAALGAALGAARAARAALAARHAVLDAVLVAARAARDAVLAAALAAAGAKLRPTTERLQQSALDLIDRMIVVTP